MSTRLKGWLRTMRQGRFKVVERFCARTRSARVGHQDTATWLRGWLVPALLLGTMAYAIAEDITITTYYPSPRGVYKELRTTDNAYLAINAGNVGIGTTSPGAKLHLRDSTAAVVLESTGAGGHQWSLVSVAGPGTGGQPGQLSVIDTTPGFGSLARFVIGPAPNGNVGIGTTTPNQKLTVSGGQIYVSNNANATGLFLQNTDTGGAEWVIQSIGNIAGRAGNLEIGRPGVSSPFNITSGGNVGIGTTDPAKRLFIDTGTADEDGIYVRSSKLDARPSLSASNSAENLNVAFSADGFNNQAGFSFGADTAWGYMVMRKNDASLYLTTAGNADVVRLGSTSHFLGNVGIGTAGPGAKLHIQGLSVGNSNNRLTNTFIPRSWELNPYTQGVDDSSFAIRDATAGKDRIAIDGSGNVGIGTANPLGIFDAQPATDQHFLVRGKFNLSDGVSLYSVNDANNAVEGLEFGASRYYFGGGNVGIGTTNPGSYQLYVNGPIFGTNLSETSDLRLKDHLMPLGGALEKVAQLNGVAFEWNDEYRTLHPTAAAGTQIGLIAQEVEKVFPELVTMGPEAQHYKAVDYTRLAAVLVEAIKEQQAQIQELKAEVEALKKGISARK